MTANTQNDSSVASRYQHLLQQLRDEALKVGRDPASILLLAVSKTHGIDRIREAWHAGARDFGENYVQEALEKITALTPESVSPPPPAGPQADSLAINWHFIGPVQSNKTRDIAGAFDWVHSVDRVKIARRLDEQRPDDKAALNVCVQVNLSDEDTKSGVSLAETAALCQEISQMDRLVLRGLMAIPAVSSDYEQQRQIFRPLKELFDELRTRHATMDTLSIGMSGDFQAAIAEGATIIRIGTALFGQRGS